VIVDQNGRNLYPDAGPFTRCSVQIVRAGSTAIGSAVASVQVGATGDALHDPKPYAGGVGFALSDGTPYLRDIDVTGDSVVTVMCTTVQSGVVLEIFGALYDAPYLT
jgi:hypothetical protein